jgi:hypothetical protein
MRHRRAAKKAITDFTWPHQSLKTALALQNQICPDQQFDVELAFVVPLTLKLEFHRPHRLQQGLSQTAETLHRHRALHATSVFG